MKKSVILFALLVAFSVQHLHAQRTNSIGRDFCQIDDLCPDPTPTPTPFPTPTPTPTPNGGSIGPKYVVLSVTYAPPGASSTVVYSNSTLFGSSLMATNSFALQSGVSVTLQDTTGPIFGFGGSNASTVSTTFGQQADSLETIAVTESATRTVTVRGPSSSGVGINHDADIIWLWLNPVLNFSIPSPNTIFWNSVGFDVRDPAGDLDVFGVPVAYLNGHQPMPANVADVLARRWAPRILCAATDPECQPDGTKGPGLTASDFAAILAADPFTDPSYLIDVPQGATCTADGRFCNATTESFEYAPPPTGQLPITETFSEMRQVAASQGITVTTSFQVAFSKEFSTALNGFLNSFVNTLKITDTLTLTNKLNLLNNEQSQQISTVSITGPTVADNYTGPAELNVFQDNVYGTFMFGAIPQPMFDLSISPGSQNVVGGSCINYVVSVLALASGFNHTVTLSASGLPSGATATFTPASVTGAGSSTLQVCTAPSTPLGASTITVKGVSGIEAHSRTASLTVTPPPDFTLGATPSSQSVVPGGTASYTVSVASLNGFSGTVALNLCGTLPTGVTAVFNPNSIAGAGTSTLSIASSASTPLGTYTICIAGASGALSHTANVTLVVGSAPTGNFTLSATPGSQTVSPGDTAFYTVSTTAVGGFAGTVMLSAGGPTGDISVDIDPSITGTGSAGLIVTTSSTTPAGTYGITITGVSGSLVHSTSVSITVSSGCLNGRDICPLQ